MGISRVLFPFTGSEMGGSHVSSFALGEALQSEFGVEVVIAAAAGSLIVQTARELDFTVIELREPARRRHHPLHELKVLPSRVRTLERLGDGAILHTHDISALQSWGPAARLAQCPVIYHNRMLNRDVLVNRLALACADRMICISRTVQDSSTWRGPTVQIDNPFRVKTINDAADYRAALFAEFGRTDEGPLIGFAGNFWGRKRPLFFLDMAKALLARIPTASFVVFGRDGEYTAGQLRAYAQEIGIAERTIFAGFRLPAERNIAILDLLAITAEKEPLGRTPLEAAMQGVPYLGFDDAGIGETGHRWGGGRLLPLNVSADAFAEEASRILRAPAEVALSADGREYLRTELSARRHAEKVLAIYRELRP